MDALVEKENEMGLIIAMFVAFALGVMSWSFSEYALHNWVGHKGKGKNEFSREHLMHHAKQMYFAPWYKKFLAAFVVFVPTGVVLGFVVGPWLSAAYTSGFAFTYLGYEWLHRRLHTHAPINAYGRWARKHHFYHHFGNPKMNHGVTSPIWDMVFGTYEPPGQIRVPAPLAMDWLCDEGASDVKEPFAVDYVISHKKKRSPKG